MDRPKHIFILLVIWSNFYGSLSQLTVEDIHELFKAFHDACLKDFPIDEAFIDEINLGRFPDDKQLKCYVNCMFESMRFIRKGKYNVEKMAKYIKMYAPVQFQEQWLRGIAACDNIAGDDPCEVSYELAQCFAKNNDHFMIPL